MGREQIRNKFNLILIFSLITKILVIFILILIIILIEKFSRYQGFGLTNWIIISNFN